MSPKTILLAGAVVCVLAGAGGAYVSIYRLDPVRQVEALIDSGKIQEAILILRRNAQDNPKDPKPLLQLARAHEQIGDMLSAQRELKRARALGADRTEIALRLAPLYLGGRQFKELIAETPSTAGAPRDAAQLLAYRSRALSGLQENAAAARTLTAAKALAADEPEVLLATARLALAKNDPAAAEAAVDTALKTDPANLEALLLKAQLRSAGTDQAAAISFSDRAVQAAPHLPSPRLARANVLMTAGQDEKARQDLDAILQNTPRSAQAIYLLCVIAVREGRFAEATAQFEVLGAAASRFPRAFYFQAIAALGQNMSATAVDYAGRYAAQSPNDPDGIRLLARAQSANNRPDLARQTLADAVAKGFIDNNTMLLYGATLADLREFSKGEAVLANLPSSPFVDTQIANAELARGDYDQAAARMEQASTTAPDSPEILQNLVAAQIGSGQLDKAANTLEQLRSKSGPTEATGTFTGMIAMARFDLPAALAAYTKTAQDYPNSPAAQANVANALVLAGRDAEARAALAKILNKAPANLLALGALVQIELRQRSINNAVAAIEAARRVSPASEPIAALYADVQTIAGNTKLAIDALQRLRVADRPQPVLIGALARAQEAAGQLDDAAATERDLLALQPDKAVYIDTTLSLARLEGRRGQPGEARRVLDQAIAKYPAELALLSARVNLENPTDARATAARLRADPAQMPAAAMLQGDLEFRLGNPLQAIAAYQAEKPLTPDLTLRVARAQFVANDDAAATATLAGLPENPEAALIRSQIAVRARNWAAAAPQLEIALRGRPNDPALLNDLAWAYHQITDPRARATARRAFLIDPNPDNADTLGWIMVQENEAANAISILDTAASQRAKDPTILYHLATALARTGQSDLARERLKQALATPDFEDKTAAQALLASLK